jgi:hypothetical protein
MGDLDGNHVPLGHDTVFTVLVPTILNEFTAFFFGTVPQYLYNFLDYHDN